MDSIADEELLGDRTPGSSAQLKRALLTLLLVALTGYSTRVLPVFRDALQDYFDISVEKLGLLYGIRFVPAAIASVLAGMFIDSKGPRSVLRVCFAGFAGGACLAALADRWGMMLLAVGTLGCFRLPLLIASQSYLVRLFPNRRRRVISLTLVTWSIAGMLYPLWAEFLLDLQAGHEGITFSNVLHAPFAVLMVPMLLGFFLHRRGNSRPQVAGASSAGRLPLSGLSRGTLMLALLAMLHMTFDCSAQAWMPRILDSGAFPVKAIRPGYVMSGFALCYAISRAGLSFLPERMGRRLLLVAPGFLGGGAFLAGVLSRNQALTALGYVGGAFLWSVEFPAILARMSEREPQRYGSAQAITLLGASLGTFALTYLMGWLGKGMHETAWWSILLIPAAGFPLVGIGGAIWIAKYGRAHDEAGAAASDLL